ncbi:mannitol 1-phosphate dehydrogenase [Aspergillus terreus]|uniref:Mannitol 1-phosphate dehydrogenase n=1 Tax=Aspergillus terreus TaxID=33178 RepID=A0A5M3Z5H7_ASPTE|nr:hypothetical protein ATETN484_0010002900 [Aspergillus terreus]GFF18079.1 mannitol 1-phosphate dehydrogenase [Aspergillus terreus]
MAFSNRVSVAIIGGGIGGLSLAIGLLQNKTLDVAIFETAPKFAEIGAGVALGPNAQQALALISPAAERAFRIHATTSLSPEFEHVWFDFRNGNAGEKDGEVLSKVENETGQQTVHRAKFLDELVKLIPREIAHFGKRLVHIQKDPVSGGAQYKLFFEDGTTASADCVIGADGIHSSVRKHLLGESHPAASPVFTGTVVYRGLIPMDVARDAIGEFADNSYMWCGDGGMVMTYPIDHGETLNVVGTRNNKGGWDGPPYARPVDEETVRNDFMGWGEIPSKVIQLLKQPTMWAILDHYPAPYYYSGNVAIMGDAAHATTPFQGAGAGQAIEDALVLSTLFQQVTNSGLVRPALAAYNDVRLRRTQKVVATSRDALRLFCFNDRYVDGDAQRWREVWDGRMDWLWGMDLEKQNMEAVNLFADIVARQSSTRETMPKFGPGPFPVATSTV